MPTIPLKRILVVLAVISYCVPLSLAAQTGSAKKVHEPPASFAFEPLDNWKAAVVAGDRPALAAFYTTNPAARAKTPQGDSLDPAEEPAFWSSLKQAGLGHFGIKVLEVKTPQPDVKTLVLRIEGDLKSGGNVKPVVISCAQVWVQRLGDWKIVSTQRGDPVDKQARRLPEPAKPNIQLYPPPEEAPMEISTALAAAAKDHKRVLLVFGGNWCYDCHVLDTTFRSKEFAPIVNANYHVIHINVGNYDANLDLADKYQIPLKKGVPSLAILDPDGALVVSQKQGEFESTVRIGPEDVLEFLKKWKPQRVSQLFSPNPEIEISSLNPHISGLNFAITLPAFDIPSAFSDVETAISNMKSQIDDSLSDLKSGISNFESEMSNVKAKFSEIESQISMETSKLGNLKSLLDPIVFGLH